MGAVSRTRSEGNGFGHGKFRDCGSPEHLFTGRGHAERISLLRGWAPEAAGVLASGLVGLSGCHEWNVRSSDLGDRGSRLHWIPCREAVARSAAAGRRPGNSYYDPALKQARLDILEDCPGFSFQRLDLADRTAINELFARHRFPVVIHLAAQAGVRYSLQDPQA